MLGCRWVCNRGIRTLRNAWGRIRKKSNSDFEETEEPFDYFGFARTQSHVDIGDEEFVEYLYKVLIDSKLESGKFPKPESHYFYIFDTAAYQQLQAIESEFDPLAKWAWPRLEQGRLYTTSEEASGEDGWQLWGADERPSGQEVNKNLCPFIGYESIPQNLNIALADLMQAYRRSSSRELERHGIFVTGYANLTKEFLRRPVMWMKFRRFMLAAHGEKAGTFELNDVRQIYECECEDGPDELPFDDIIPKPMWREVYAFSYRLKLSLERLPLTLPDWYDEFPLDSEFWSSLPDPVLHPWDRKHEWFKLRRPDPCRQVFFCDLDAYKVLSRELEENQKSKLGRWASQLLKQGRLYVRDWESPGFRGLPRRNEDLERRNEKGWKLLPWPMSTMDFAAEKCPALSRASWPVRDYEFIVDRYLKDNVFVTGDPEVAAEVGNRELRNWLLSIGVHLVHDVRQVFSCGSENEPVAINLD